MAPVSAALMMNKAPIVTGAGLLNAPSIAAAACGIEGDAC